MTSDPCSASVTCLSVTERETRLVRAQAIARIGSWELNLATRRMWASTEAFRIYGLELTPDNEMPLELVQTVPLVEYRTLLDHALAELLAGTKPYDIDFEICRHNDGAIRHIHSLAELVRNTAGKPVFISGTLHDNTELVARDRALLTALRTSEERARLTFEQAADAIFLGNPAGDFIGVNERAVELSGYSREELLLGNISMLFDGHTQETVPLQYERIRSGELVIRERELRRKDGSCAFVEMHTKRLSDGTLQSIMRDLTERRHLEQQLQLRQRMDSIGTLTSGIAHDFNNILAGIMGYTQLLAETPESLDQDQLECVSNILQATKRATDLVRSLRSLTRPQPSAAGSSDLFDVATEVVKVLQATTDRVIRKELRLKPKRCVVRGNGSDLYHALMNLGVNAVQAIEQKGATAEDLVLFDAQPCELGPNSLFGLPTGHYAHVTVSDTGTGMPPEVRERAFEPLYSTKSYGERKGQGLGLAMVYNIVVHQHGGAVDIETSVNKGCRFHLYLPCAEEVSPNEPHPQPASLRGSERILVVEDEPLVAQLARKLLERNGYSVLHASDGREALELFERQHQSIHLVLLDRSLPGMRGDQLFQRMRDLCPDIAVVVSSGDASLCADSFPGAFRVLQKPYAPMLLVSAVRAALDEHPKTKPITKL
jgi:two-component system, cell cycle sensor histidine kinase and response regulator CckA